MSALRGENIVCGTSTTGTGTLTLAATPVAPGGIDFDVLARATGVGFANSAAVLVSYTVIEYTDSTFGTAKSTEKGIGTLTLGGSSGIANCTLARTTVQVTATSLNSQPATYNTNSPAAFSIATAANVLVIISPSAADVAAYLPYYETGVGDNLGVPLFVSVNGSTGNTANLVSATDWYMPFEWRVPMLVKKASMRVAQAYATGSPVSNAYGRIYAMNSSGRPGKLLLDLGLFGASNTSLNSTGNISTAAHATGYYLTPGIYFFDFLPSFSGGSTLPQMVSPSACLPLANQLIGATSFVVQMLMKATSGTAGAGPDPANVTGYTNNAGGNGLAAVSLAPS